MRRTVIGGSDIDPPEFSVAPASSNITATTYQITATMDEPGTVYSYAVARGASQPSNATIIADGESDTDSGSGVTIPHTGVTPATQWDVWVLPVDTALNEGAAVKVEVNMWLPSDLGVKLKSWRQMAPTPAYPTTYLLTQNNDTEVASFLDLKLLLAKALVYTSDFSAGEDSFAGTRLTVVGNTDGISGQDNVLKMYCDNSNNTHFAARTIGTSGTSGEFSIMIFIPTNTNVNGVKIQLSNNLPQLTLVAPALNTWLTYTIPAYMMSTAFRIYPLKNGAETFVGANSSSDDIVYVRTITWSTYAGNHKTQITASAQPTLNAGYIESDGGVSKAIGIASSTQSYDGDSSGEVHLKWRDSAGSGVNLPSVWSAQATLNLIGFGVHSDDRLMIRYNNGVSDNDVKFVGTITRGQVNVTSFISTGSAYACWNNGVVKSVDAGTDDGNWDSDQGVVSLNRNFLMSSQKTVGTAFYDSDIRADIYTSGLTDGERTLLHEYLGAL